MPKGVFAEYRWPSCGTCGNVFLHTQGRRPANCGTCKPRRDRAVKAAYRASKGSEWRKGQALKTRYGITFEDFAAMADRQGGKCALCAAPSDSQPSGYLSVDHCHETGRIRGLLCVNCNVSIGKLGDSVEGLERAIRYLKGL